MPDPDLQGFVEALDRFGPQLHRWPARARYDGDALLARSHQARRQLDLAERAHRLTGACLATDAPPLLASRILVYAASHDERPAWRRWLDTFVEGNLVALGAGAAVALLACGVLIGAVDGPAQDEDAPAIVAFLASATAGFDEGI